MVFDLRAQTNEAMEELIEKKKAAVINGAKQLEPRRKLS
jgi:hypothetical protein